MGARVLKGRLAAARARPRSDDDHERADRIADAVDGLLDAAVKAATRKDPVPSRIGNWWRGTLIEAAYQNLHAAEALIVSLYDEDEVAAEIPEAWARVEVALDRDDPRRQACADLSKTDPRRDPSARAKLRKAIEVGHAAADQEHSRLRSFRNAVMCATAVLAILVAGFVLYVFNNPSTVPLCFTPSPEGANPALFVCPTAEYPLTDGVADKLDIIVVALLGLMGGAMAAAFSIKNLQGTSTPYGVPVALAGLKLPLGALTAIGGLLALRGQFIPGLSELDSQAQILAYALVLGYAQQLFSKYIDQQAQRLLAAAPGKDRETNRPERVQTTADQPQGSTAPPVAQPAAQPIAGAG